MSRVKQLMTELEEEELKKETEYEFETYREHRHKDMQERIREHFEWWENRDEF